MSNTKIVTEVVKKSNTLEDAFGIPSGSTEITVEKPVTIATSIEMYDEKDKEIEQQLDVIKDMAQYQYEKIQDTIEDVEPKYAGRLHEVSNAVLSTMLDAVKSKAKIKIEKDKLVVKQQNPTKINQTTNNTIISSPTDIIRNLRNGTLNTIEGEFVVKQENNNDDENS